MTPAHVAPLGTSLPAVYFSPGTYIMRGVEIGSPWAIAYYAGVSYRYERVGLGQVWVRMG